MFLEVPHVSDSVYCDQASDDPYDEDHDHRQVIDVHGVGDGHIPCETELEEQGHDYLDSTQDGCSVFLVFDSEVDHRESQRKLHDEHQSIYQLRLEFEHPGVPQVVVCDHQ